MNVFGVPHGLVPGNGVPTYDPPPQFSSFLPAVHCRLSRDVNPPPISDPSPSPSFQAIYFLANLADYFPKTTKLDSETEKQARRRTKLTESSSRSGGPSQVALKTVQFLYSGSPIGVERSHNR